MRTVIAQIYDYSLDGILPEEGTSFFDFCRELPEDPADVDRTRDFYQNADVLIMGRNPSLIRLDLIDEYRVRLVPYLAGQGTRLFSDLPQPARLEFVSANPAGGGITELAFRRIVPPRSSSGGRR